MRLVSIQEAINYGPGETIPAIRGTLKAVFQRREGVGHHGPWSVQNGFLTDGQHELKVAFWGHEDLSRLKGQQVYLECCQSDKGLTGLKMMDNEHNGAVRPELKVTGSATIEVVNGAGQQSAPPPSPRQQAQQTRTNGNGNGHDPIAEIKSVRKWMANRASLYVLCLEAGDHVRKLYDDSHLEPMTDEQYQAVVSSFFINANHGSIGAGLPPDVTKYHQPFGGKVERQPEPAPEPVPAYPPQTWRDDVTPADEIDEPPF